MIPFATFVEYTEQIPQVRALIDSLRRFGGRYAQNRVLVYTMSDLRLNDGEIVKVDVPEQAMDYALGAKPYFAEKAEHDLRDYEQFLYLDPNIVFLGPNDILLSENKKLGWRPVFHRNIGCLWDEGPDEFWQHVFNVCEVDQSLLFQMQTVADDLVLLPSFNCGFVLARPELGIMTAWRASFEALMLDKWIASHSRDGLNNVFLHQAALVPAILNSIEEEDLLRLPDTYNVPILFHLFWESKRKYEDISECRSIKYEMPGSVNNWCKLLKGPREKIEYLRDNLPI